MPKLRSDELNRHYRVEGYEAGRKKKWTKAEDEAWDKAHGIKPNSKQDKRLDRKRGVK